MEEDSSLDAKGPAGKLRVRPQDYKECAPAPSTALMRRTSGPEAWALAQL